MLRTELSDHRRSRESDLLRALAARDPLAFAEAYHRTVAGAHACARRLLSSSADVEALLRTVYAELWERPPTQGPLEGWVRARCFALGAEELRARGAAPSSPSTSSLLTDLPKPDVRYLDAAERALAELHEEDRHALLLAHDRGVSGEGQPVGGGQALTRALLALAGPETSTADDSALADDACDDVAGMGDWTLGLVDEAAATAIEAAVAARPGCAARVRALRRGRRRLEGLPPTPDMGQRILVTVLTSEPGSAASEPASEPGSAASEPASEPAAAPAPRPEQPLAVGSPTSPAGVGARPTAAEPSMSDDEPDEAEVTTGELRLADILGEPEAGMPAATGPAEAEGRPGQPVAESAARGAGLAGSGVGAAERPAPNGWAPASDDEDSAIVAITRAAAPPAAGSPAAGSPAAGGVGAAGGLGAADESGEPPPAWSAPEGATAPGTVAGPGVLPGRSTPVAPGERPVAPGERPVSPGERPVSPGEPTAERPGPPPVAAAAGAPPASPQPRLEDPAPAEPTAERPGPPTSGAGGAHPLGGAPPAPEPYAELGELDPPALERPTGTAGGQGAPPRAADDGDAYDDEAPYPEEELFPRPSTGRRVLSGLGGWVLPILLGCVIGLLLAKLAVDVFLSG